MSRLLPRTRIAGAACVVALAATSLAGCSSSGASHPIGSAPASGTVVFWTRSALDPWTKGVVADFNASHKGIRVQVTSIEDANLVTKLSTVLRTDNVPDVVATDDVDALPFISKHLFLNITRQVRAAGLQSKLNAAQLNLATVNGQFYGTPAVADLSVLLYNKALFKAAGILRPPSTLAEILVDAKKIRALSSTTYGFTFAGNCPGCLTFTVLPDVYAAGSDIFSGGLTDQNATVAGNLALQHTLQFYRDIWTSGVAPKANQSNDGSTWGQDFDKGNIGMAPGGLFIRASASKVMQANIGVTGLPGPAGGVSTYIGGADFGIPAKAKNAAGAWQFIQYALSASEQKFAAKAGYAPVLTALTQDTAFLSQYPYVEAGLKAAQTGNAPKTLYHNELFTQQSGPWLQMFQRAVFKGDVSGAIQNGQAAFTSVLTGGQ